MKEAPAQPRVRQPSDELTAWTAYGGMSVESGLLPRVGYAVRAGVGWHRAHVVATSELWATGTATQALWGGRLDAQATGAAVLVGYGARRAGALGRGWQLAGALHVGGTQVEARDVLQARALTHLMVGVGPRFSVVLPLAS